MTPCVEEHRGVFVVRDDMFPGGTKARFLPSLFAGAEEIVYASPAEGGAQTALAHVAGHLGKQATIFVAKRRNPHARTLLAKRLGAKVLQVRPGYLNVVRRRAEDYCAATGACLAPFGLDFPAAVSLIAESARRVEVTPDEVWCAAGSGVLARALAQAWPDARRHVVQVGRSLNAAEVAGAVIHIYPRAFGQHAASSPPFPSDPHYDAKAWEICLQRKGPGAVLFWNVTGPAGLTDERQKAAA